MSCRYCRGKWGLDLDEARYSEMGDASVTVVRPPKWSAMADFEPHLRVEVGIFGVGFSNRYKINFCPMCGRDLRGGDEW